VLDRLAWC